MVPHAASSSVRAPADPARNAWAAVTIRVAWDLVAAGMRPNPAFLAEARDHALMCLPARCDRLQAEELAGHFTAELLARVQHGRYAARPPAIDEVPVRPSWRERVVAALDPIGEVVLRLHYGDGLTLEQVAKATRVDRSILLGAQEGVRSAFRAVMTEDAWRPDALDRAALDRVLVRVARLPTASCEGGQSCLDPANRDHVEKCPRCTRGVRLVRAGVLSPGDLVPQSRPADSVSVLAIHLHPEARHHRKILFEALSPGAVRADEDALLVDLDRIENHVPVIQHLAGLGTPAKEHVRGAILRGPGRWTNAGLIGPVAAAALELTRSRPWGEVDGCGPLPELEKHEAPPLDSRWWGGAAVATLAAVLAATWALRTPEVPTAFPLHTWNDGGAIRFDVDDEAQLLVVRGDTLELVLASERPWDKGDLATGDGDFLLEGGPALIATSSSSFADAQALLDAARGADEPLEELAERVRSTHPDADLALVRPRVVASAP